MLLLLFAYSLNLQNYYCFEYIYMFLKICKEMIFLKIRVCWGSGGCVNGHILWFWMQVERQQIFKAQLTLTVISSILALSLVLYFKVWLKKQKNFCMLQDMSGVPRFAGRQCWPSAQLISIWGSCWICLLQTLQLLEQHAQQNWCFRATTTFHVM